MSKNIAYGLGILLVALMLYLTLFTSPHKTPSVISEGKIAPDFTLKTLDGRKVTLSELRGKVVLLNFWASWCPPCRGEMPLFEKIYERYKNRGFEILAVSTDSSADPVKKFVKEFGITFPVLLDDGKVSGLYSIQGLPTSFLIDREGRIVKVRLGKYREIEEDLKKIL